MRVVPAVSGAQGRDSADRGPQDGPKDGMVCLGRGVWLGADLVFVADREDPSCLLGDDAFGEVHWFRGREVTLV